jgi:hypothetical protein
MNGSKEQNQDTGYMWWSNCWYAYARDLMARPSTMLQVRVDSAWRLGFRHMYTGYRVMACQWFKSSRRMKGWRVARTPVKKVIRGVLALDFGHVSPQPASARQPSTCSMTCVSGVNSRAKWRLRCVARPLRNRGPVHVFS